MNTLTPNISYDENGNQTANIGNYQLTIIKSLCIGAGSCMATAEGVFKVNDQNIAEFLTNPNADPQTLLFAAQVCPTSAIIIKDLKTGQQLYPKST